MAASENGEKIIEKLEFKEYKLENGLDVILSRDTSIPSVAINLCYHVGSKDEDTNKRGFAHLFEHLMFEGSKNIPPGDYDKICVSAGGENNAYTNEDKTNYFILMPAHQLELGLWMESDRMLGFAITPKSFKTQKEVVREEKSQIFDNRPYGTISLEFMPRLYKNSGYAWDTIGDMDEIDKATLRDAKEFYDKYYVPANAILTVVGDIDFDNAILLIEKYFADIPPGTGVHKKTYKEEEQGTEIKDTIYDSVQLPGIFMGYRIPPENNEEFYPLDILTDILSTGDSSRLYNELVYEKQLCSEIGCYVDPHEFSGVLYIYAILMPDVSIDETEKEVDRIISEVSNGGLTENELQKVKNKMEMRFAYKKQTLLSKADTITHYKMFYNDPGLIDTGIESYDKVTLQDIKSAAKKYLQKNNRVVLYCKPRESEN